MENICHCNNVIFQPSACTAVSSKPSLLDFLFLIETSAWGRGGSNVFVVLLLRCMLSATRDIGVILGLFMDFYQLSHCLSLHASLSKQTQTRCPQKQAAVCSKGKHLRERCSTNPRLQQRCNSHSIAFCAQQLLFTCKHCSSALLQTQILTLQVHMRSHAPPKTHKAAENCSAFF